MNKHFVIAVESKTGTIRAYEKENTAFTPYSPVRGGFDRVNHFGIAGWRAKEAVCAAA